MLLFEVLGFLLFHVLGNFSATLAYGSHGRLEVLFGAIELCAPVFGFASGLNECVERCRLCCAVQFVEHLFQEVELALVAASAFFLNLLQAFDHLLLGLIDGMARFGLGIGRRFL